MTMLQSIIRYLVVSALAYLVGHGVITQDIANADTAAVVNYVIIGVTVIGSIAWSYFEKKYKGVLIAYLPKNPGPGSNNLGPTSPAIVGLLLPILAICGTASVLMGCSAISGSTYTYTPTGVSTPVTITGFAAWCENNLIVIRSATKSTIVIVADELTKNGTTKTRIAGYVRSAESALQPLLSQSSVSQADLENALGKVKVNDAEGIYADAISPAITLVGGYLVTLQSDGAPAKVTIDVLTALNNGLNDAAVALDPAGT